MARRDSEKRSYCRPCSYSRKCGMREGVTVPVDCMMDLCPVKWARDPCLPSQDICRHGHISAEVGSIETFPSPTLPRPRTPSGGSDTWVRNWHVPFGMRIPHAVSMRLKMERCNVWDMPADSMHEPPPTISWRANSQPTSHRLRENVDGPEASTSCYALGAITCFPPLNHA